MLFLVNFYHENTWEDIEDEFGDEWRMKTRKRVGERKRQRGRRLMALFKTPTTHRR